MFVVPKWNIFLILKNDMLAIERNFQTFLGTKYNFSRLNKAKTH